MEKTILCEKVIDLENLVEVSGVNFKLNNNFWTVIGTKAGLPMR